MVEKTNKKVIRIPKVEIEEMIVKRSRLDLSCQGRMQKQRFKIKLRQEAFTGAWRGCLRFAAQVDVQRIPPLKSPQLCVVTKPLGR